MSCRGIYGEYDCQGLVALSFLIQLFSRFRSSPECVLGPREICFLNTLIHGKNLGNFSRIRQGPNAPDPGWLSGVSNSFSSGGLNLTTFSTFSATTEIASKSILGAFAGLISFAMTSGMSIGFTESILFVHWYWKQSEIGWQLSPGFLTLWSFFVKNNYLFSCNLSGISFLTELWRILVAWSSVSASFFFRPCRRTCKVLALSVHHLLVQRCLTRLLWRESYSML